MKIDDVSLTIFTWDNIPATRYHLGSLASSASSLGLLRIHTDEGLEGHAFLGAATNPASMDGPQLIRSLKPMLMGKIRWSASASMARCGWYLALSVIAQSAQWTPRCGISRARSPSCRCTR